MFETLTDEQIATLVDGSELIKYSRGQPVIKQGEVGDEFYVVWNGSAVATVSIGTGDEKDEQEHRRYEKGDRFGELSFMQGHGAVRGATVTARTALELLCFRHKTFERLFGPLDLVQKESYML